ncbi:MAG TPA: TetR/AcrR family transcriptional regulator [Pseudonocardiaceae bacterium]|jgi:AcrR family transcriptional regulator|nr:TetR/AcrR family transcriptional regulator [Pseudonocardiaceae bacterium]
MGTRERIVMAMAELMRVQGYGATGVNQLVSAADAPTGSIYHHFKGGKHDVAAAALRQTGAAYGQLLPLLLDAHADLATGIESAFAQAAEDMRTTGWANMCPVATVTAEVADTDPALRQVGADVMGDWVETGSRYFAARGLSDTDARAVTHAVITGLEGAFLVARGLRSTEPFLAVGRTLADYVRTLPTTAAATG